MCICVRVSICMCMWHADARVTVSGVQVRLRVEPLLDSLRTKTLRVEELILNRENFQVIVWLAGRPID